MSMRGTPEGQVGEITEYGRTKKGDIRVRARYRPYGKKPIAVYGVGRTFTLARRDLLSKISERNETPMWQASQSMTLAAAVPQWKADTVAGGHQKPSTYTEYFRLIDRNVLPVLGDTAFKDLSTGSVTRFLQGMIGKASTGNAKGGYTQSHATLIALRQLTSWAIKNDIISSNPCRDAVVPQRPRELKPLPRALTPAEARTLVEACRQYDTQLPGAHRRQSYMDLSHGVELMLATGLRIGELSVLLWSDIDLSSDSPNVSIQATYTEVAPAEAPPEAHRQDSPKTELSNRTIPLGPHIAAILRSRKAVPAPASSRIDAVFPSRRGGAFLTPNGFRNRLRKVTKLLTEETGQDWSWITPHSFRDTAATRLAEAHGVEAAAMLLGHSSPSITEKHYFDRDRTIKKFVADTLDAHWAESSDN